MTAMRQYPEAAVERAMKVQEVLLRAMAKRITWWQAAEILGITERSMRRWRARMEKYGDNALIDRRRGKPSAKRVSSSSERTDGDGGATFELNTTRSGSGPDAIAPQSIRPSHTSYYNHVDAVGGFLMLPRRRLRVV